MAKFQHKSQFQNNNLKIDTKLQLFSFLEDNCIVLYSPALDLCGYGMDEVEAKNSFNIVLEEFFKYITNKNTIILELQKLGWIIKGGKKRPNLSAPDITHMLSTNKELSKIINTKDFKKFEENIAIPQFA